MAPADPSLVVVGAAKQVQLIYGCPAPPVK
jgi:hypothetical protein